VTARKATAADLPDWPRLLGRDKAAAYLDMSPNMLDTLPLVPVKIGTRRLYDRRSLDRLVDNLSGGAESSLSASQWLDKLS
jgi:hypothetical protein